MCCVRRKTREKSEETDRKGVFAVIIKKKKRKKGEYRKEKRKGGKEGWLKTNIIGKTRNKKRGKDEQKIFWALFFYYC